MSLDEPTIPCGGCGKPTPMLGTKLCDPCWHIRQAGVDPRLARAAEELLEACKGYLESRSLFEEARAVSAMRIAVAKAEGKS